MAVVNQSVSAEKLIKELRKHGCQPGDEEAGGGEGDGDFDWQKLGQAVGILFATVPPFETLCGPIRSAFAPRGNQVSLGPRTARAPKTFHCSACFFVCSLS